MICSKWDHLSGRLAALGVSVLNVEDLQIERNGQELLSGLSFMLDASQLIVIVGGNGAGKSSLLASLVGLLPVAEGCIQRLGAEHIFYLGHKRGLRRDLTVLENLQQDLRYVFDAEKAAVAIQACGLAELQSRFVRDLSAGQQQRVALAKLWLTQATLWVLDEPLEALDAVMRETLEAKLEDHLRKRGSAVVATHIPLCRQDLITQTITLGGEHAI